MSSNLYADVPLKYPADDKLGYAKFSESLARSLVRMSPEDGFVMALFGEWGSGKSTVINFIQTYIKQYKEEEQPIILPFNPWWFTNTNDLVLAFFSQMLNKLKQRHYGYQLNKIAEKMKGLASAVSSMPGGQLAGFAAAGLDMMTKADVVSLKENISERLSERKKRLLVIIDDIDRLSREEMLQMFTLIKAIANFPYVTYLLAFDRSIVEETLEDHGKSYLEKIIQASFELPLPSQDGMLNLLVDQLSGVLGKLPPALFERTLLGNTGMVYTLTNSLKTPRKIMRFINSLRVTYPAVKGEVFISDFVFLEYLRLYHSDAYLEIRNNKRLMTSSGARTKDAAALLRKKLSILPEDILSVVLSMFPAIDEQNPLWSRRASPSEREALRMAGDPLSFDTYFRFSVSDERITKHELEFIYAASEDSDSLQSSLEQYAYQSESRRIDLARSLALVTKRISVDRSRNFVKAIFRVGDKFLSTERRSFFLGDVHSQLVSLVEQFLENFPREVRCMELLNLVKMSTSPYIILRLIVSLRLEHGIGDPSPAKRPEERILETAEVLELDRIALKLIREVTSRDDFFANPHWLTALHLWVDLSDENAKIWLREKLNSPKTLITFIRQFLSFSLGEPEKIGELSQGIELYFPIQELLKIAEETFSSSYLDEVQQEQANELLRLLQSINGKDSSEV